MKKIIFSFFFLFLLFGFLKPVLAEGININFFYSNTCPHCAEERVFLDDLEKKHSEIKVKKHVLSGQENINLLKEFYNEYEVPVERRGYVPISFIREKYFLGFDEEIKENIECYIGELIEKKNGEPCGRGGHGEGVTAIGINEELNVPILGKVDASKYSLPVLAVMLGGLDGFNVCSLGALILILGLVLALRSRKKTLIFGGLFILTTALIYGFLIVLWYQLFSFLAPHLRIMEILIGVLGLGGGFYFLKQFIKYRKYGPTCEMGTGKGIMAKFSGKFKGSMEGSKNILLLLGMVFLFAAIITVVEFPCSAAVPVVFAGILANAQLSTFSYLLYISLFVIFYMLDEIVVFLIAFFTMKIWLASSKALTWIILVEAVILFGLGAYYLFGFIVIF